MPQDETAFLSNELEELIRSLYAPADQASVRDTLLWYASAAMPNWETERVQFDLLHLGAGDTQRVKQLAEAAARDPRDVMGGEYFWVAGRSYPHPWARRHAINRDLPEPPDDADLPLCVARLLLRPQRGTVVGGKRLALLSLLLEFADNASLLNFAAQLLILDQPERAIDLSKAVPFHQGGLRAEGMVLRCVRAGEPDTLAFAGSILTWSGAAEYWIACHLKCLRLAENGQGFQDMMKLRAADQQVRISLRGTAHT